MNVYTMSIFHLKYKQFRMVRKFNHDVNISLEICVTVFHLIKNVNISLDFVQLLLVVCSTSKMSIFHWKYV